MLDVIYELCDEKVKEELSLKLESRMGGLATDRQLITAVVELSTAFLRNGKGNCAMRVRDALGPQCPQTASGFGPLNDQRDPSTGQVISERCCEPHAVGAMTAAARNNAAMIG